MWTLPHINPSLYILPLSIQPHIPSIAPSTRSLTYELLEPYRPPALTALILSCGWAAGLLILYTTSPAPHGTVPTLLLHYHRKAQVNLSTVSLPLWLLISWTKYFIAKAEQQNKMLPNWLSRKTLWSLMMQNASHFTFNLLDSGLYFPGAAWVPLDGSGRVTDSQTQEPLLSDFI